MPPRRPLPRTAPTRPDLVLFREVWRKAVRAGGHLRLPFPEASHATRARLQLYNALKAVREGAQRDDELLTAWETLEIVREGPSVLVIRPRTDGEIAQALTSALGIDPAELPRPSEVLTQAAPDAPATPSAAILALVEPAVAGEGSPANPSSPSTNPYYSR